MVDWGFGEDIDTVAPCLPGQRTGEDPVEHWKESQRLARRDIRQNRLRWPSEMG